jgi:hypothetical protein
MKKVRWIIQDKNYADDDRQEIIDACEKRGIPCVEISVIPFSEALPEFPVDDEYENIYYGSTTMMDRVYSGFNKPVGLFYNHETFSMENYLEKWGEHMLSSEAKFMRFEDFRNSDHPADQKFFIRPDADSKSFAGVVVDFGGISEWYDKLTKEDVFGLGPDTKIMAGPAYNIEKEWRNYVVNGKVITSSMYRKNFKLHKDGEDIPQEMIDYVEARCKEYSPHDVIAFDVAKCQGEHEYYIIECGCMNSVGFYHCDIDKYVEALTNYVETTP